MKIKTLVALAAIICLVAVIGLTNGSHLVSGQATGSLSLGKCSVITSTAIEVGNQESVQILATSTKRAWATIQQPGNATNTLALAFTQGDNAVLGAGYQLHDYATSTGHTDQVSFGLYTTFPYISSVDGLTNNGSSTVLVTECNY